MLSRKPHRGILVNHAWWRFWIASGTLVAASAASIGIMRNGAWVVWGGSACFWILISFWIFWLAKCPYCRNQCYYGGVSTMPLPLFRQGPRRCANCRRTILPPRCGTVQARSRRILGSVAGVIVLILGGLIAIEIGAAFQETSLFNGGVFLSVLGVILCAILLTWTMCPSCGDYLWTNYDAVEVRPNLAFGGRAFRMGKGLLHCMHCNLSLVAASRGAANQAKPVEPSIATSDGRRE